MAGSWKSCHIKLCSVHSVKLVILYATFTTPVRFFLIGSSSHFKVKISIINFLPFATELLPECSTPWKRQNVFLKPVTNGSGKLISSFQLNDASHFQSSVSKIDPIIKIFGHIFYHNFCLGDNIPSTIKTCFKVLGSSSQALI